MEWEAILLFIPRWVAICSVIEVGAEVPILMDINQLVFPQGRTLKEITLKRVYWLKFLNCNSG